MGTRTSEKNKRNAVSDPKTLGWSMTGSPFPASLESVRPS